MHTVAPLILGPLHFATFDIILIETLLPEMDEIAADRRNTVGTMGWPCHIPMSIS